MAQGGRYDALELECEGDTKLEKGGVFSGLFHKSSKHTVRSASAQSSQPVDEDLSGSKDSLSEPSSTKKGVLGKLNRLNPFNTSTQERELLDSGEARSEENLFEAKQDDLSTHRELSASNDSLSDTTNKKGGRFVGMFKKPPKLYRDEKPDKDTLSMDEGLSASTDSLSEPSSTKKGVLGKLNRLNPFNSLVQQDTEDQLSDSRKPLEEKHSEWKRDDLSTHRELSASNDSLSDTTNKKGGRFVGMFKRSPKLHRDEKPDKDTLSMDEGLSASNDSLSEPSSTKKGVLGKLNRLNPFGSSAQEKTEETPEFRETTPSDRRSKFKQNADTDSESEADMETHSKHKQNVLVGAMAKLNPFGSAQREKEAEQEPLDDNQAGRKQAVGFGVFSKLKPFHAGPKKNTAEVEPSEDAPQTEEGTVGSRNLGKVRENRGGPGRKDEAAVAPPVPPRHTDKELNNTISLHRQRRTEMDSRQELSADVSHDQVKEGHVEAQADSEDQLEKEEVTEEKPKKKGKKKKKKNPFMPHVAAKAKIPKKGQDEDLAENDGQKKSLMEQLDELRFDRDEGEEDQDLDGLMEWWNTVEQWEDTPKDEDMTPKEEAKAFAVTAEKVQKGIRVFNKLFTERAEGLWQHIIDLNAIADGLDRFSKRTKIAQITGGSTSAVGGVATIAGLALAPVTFGTSLIVTAVGLGVATAGGLTSASAGISNTVNNSLDRKKVERIVEDYQEKMEDLNKCMRFIKQGIENLRQFNLVKMKDHTYNRDFPNLNNIYEDGAMAGKAILINANEIMRVVQIANVAGSTAARAVQIASMATGVLTGLFVGMDIYFVAKDSRELKKGAKSEFAGKIREVAEQLHGGLVELNGIHYELQSTSRPEETTTPEPTAPESEQGFNEEVSDFKKDKSDFHKEKSDFMENKSDFHKEKSDLMENKPTFQTEKSDFRKEKSDIKREKSDFTKEKSDIKREKSDFKKEKLDFKREELFL